MSDMDQISSTRIPVALTLLLIVVIGLGMAIALIGGYSLFAGPIRTDTSSLGTQGDFFGGHIAASVGALTLAIVIYTSYRQSLQQDRYFSRQYFIQGADLITTAIRDKDTISAMRFIEYYSRLALSKKDGELYLILNAVLYGDVRKQLESDDQTILNNYPYAVSAMKEIGSLLKSQSMKRKGINQS
jgi:hypothetical protein